MPPRSLGVQKPLYHLQALAYSDMSSPQLTNGLDSRVVSQIQMNFQLKAIISVSLFLKPAHKLTVKCK